MTIKYYTQLWVAVCDKIHKIITREKKIQKYGTISQPRSAFIIFAELYLGYISILNEVSDVFDQTLQVQKREVVRRILISVTKRVSELRRELCAIEMNEFIYIDQTLVDARLTPQDIVFNRPHYFPKRRPDVYNEIIDKYIHRNESVEVDEHKHRVFPVDSMKTKTEIEFTFLGILENCNHLDEVIQFIECGKENKRSQMKQYENDFQKIVLDTKTNFLNKKTQSIKDDVSDFIRNWFRVMYEAAGDFDTYPPSAKGGSMTIMKGETMSPAEFRDYTVKGIKSVADRKDDKPKEKKKDKKKKNAKKPEWDFSELSSSFVALETVINEYKRDWNLIDEMNNPKEMPYMEFIEPNEFVELHQELHMEVDKHMREEYELLRKARCKDLKTKYKKTKIKNAKNKKRKKGKGAGKKKKKQGPDMTAERTIGSLIVELIENDILIDVPKKSFDDFIGDYNYLAYDREMFGIADPPPCLGELKSTIRTWILGMGPVDLPKTKSICMLGPSGCGKKHIIYALAAELGAVVFNLSSDVVAKYKDDMPYFVHLVTKMASVLQPSVLFIDEAHKTFIKKAPTTALKTKYTLLGKFLPKMLKLFKSNDRILLLGATNEPWNAARPKLKKCYEKFVVVPTEQYADKFLIWQIGIQKRLGFTPNIEISSLARVNIEYSAASILNAIDQVLNTSRMNMIRTIPLDANEFLYAMSNQAKPLWKKHTEKYRKWYDAVDKLAKARKQYIRSTQKKKK